MKLFNASREDYLKALLVLQNRMGIVHSVDISRYLGISKASVSRAVSNLVKGGFIYVESDFSIKFTEEGRKTAESVYERYKFFAKYLMSLGIDEMTAETDACKLEHAISDKSFKILKLKTKA